MAPRPHGRPPTDLVLVVPGLDVETHGRAVERLAECLDRFLSTHGGVAHHRITTWQGEGVCRALLHLKQGDGRERRVELREFAWSDLRPSKEVSIPARLWRGARLVGYWLVLLRFRRIPKTSESMRGWIFLAVFLLMAWYAVLLAAGLHLLLAADSLEPVFDRLGWAQAGVKDVLGPGHLWGLVVAALGTRALMDGVDVSWTTFAFMSDRDAFRRKLRARLAGVLAHIATASPRYGRVVLIAHSFGSAVAADALGAPDRSHSARPDVHFVTLGSPLEFLSCRDPGVLTLVQRCLDAPAVRSWTDFYAEEDAFCSKVPLADRAGEKFTGRRVVLDRGFWACAFGRAHDAYYGHPDVLGDLLGLLGLPPAPPAGVPRPDVEPCTAQDAWP